MFVRSLLLSLTLLAACSSGDDRASESADTASESSVGTASGTATADADRPAQQTVRQVRLTGFECGDNCYVRIALPSASDNTARPVLCTAPQCRDWQGLSELPADWRNATVRATFGRADQVDNNGTTMAAGVEAIVAMARVETPAPTPTPSAAPDHASLPLDRGIYVLAGSGCEAPANASFRVWDGRGLSGSATRACRSSVLSTDGATYRIANDCEDTYGGKRSTETVQVTIPDPRHFQTDNGAFAKCAPGTTPAWLNKLLDTTPAPEPTTAAHDLRTVPPRFRGLFARDKKACAEDYSYQPAFENVRVSADEVSFFETGGPVTDVKIDGDSAAITLRETVGDRKVLHAIFLALNPDGTVRYRVDRGTPPRTYVRCSS